MVWSILTVLLASVAAQERSQIVRMDAVRIGLTRDEATLSFVSGQAGHFLVQQGRRTSDGGMSSVVFEINMQGKHVGTYDLDAVLGRKTPFKNFTVDSSGNVYFFLFSSPEDPDPSVPVVYVFQQGGKFLRKVRLSGNLSPHQMAISPDGSWLVAARSVTRKQEPQSAQTPRPLLYEFNPDGSLVREFPLPQSTRTEYPESPWPPARAVWDLSHLLVDSSGNLFLIHPTARPAIFKFDASGNLLLQRRLAELPGTWVITAILDDHDRLVLDRGLVRRSPQEPLPTSQARVLCVLNPFTLETVVELEPSPLLGRLGAVRGGEMFFLANHPALGLELVRAVVR